MVCFPLMGNNRTREKLWCVCPLGTLLLGLQEALLHLVCMCVCVCVRVCVCGLVSPRNGVGEGGRRKRLHPLCVLMRAHFLLLSKKEPATEYLPEEG